MSRWMGTAFLCLMSGVSPLSGQDKKPADTKTADQQVQAPPEEDEGEKPKEYSFNPLQANKEMTVGNFYLHKGDFRAAAVRFMEATRWNPTSADAYFLLGEAEEKQRAWNSARDAYQKFLDLASDDKRAPEVRKKVEKLSKGKH